MTEQEIRNKVQARITELGTNVSQVARETEIDRSVIYRWLSGETRIRLEFAIKIGEVLGMEINMEKIK